MNVKLNHLLPRSLGEGWCAPKGKQHYWVPATEPEAKIGGGFGLPVYCSHCGLTHYVFLSSKDHSTFETLIEKSLNISRKRLTAG